MGEDEKIISMVADQEGAKFLREAIQFWMDAHNPAFNRSTFMGGASRNIGKKFEIARNSLADLDRVIG